MEKTEDQIFKEEEASRDYEFQKMLRNLPKEVDILSAKTLYFYQGFWISERLIKSIVFSLIHFLARNDDLLLASCPKSGTTWLKALAFSIVNRSRFNLSNSPLLLANPHDLVPSIEVDLYKKYQFKDFENMPQPRLLATHTPYALLPPSIKNSNCKIVYIYRNPMDLFVSHWHFFPKLKGENVEPSHIEECFDIFCRGIHFFGPFWEHVLGFWNASLEIPEKILFLRYEDLKENTLFCIKQLAEFLGFPFSEEEEKHGLIEEISKLCSIENLKSVEARLKGKHFSGMPNNAFFRKGVVGDWKTYLTPSMVHRMEKLIKEKFQNHNLAYKFLPNSH